MEVIFVALEHRAIEILAVGWAEVVLAPAETVQAKLFFGSLKRYAFSLSIKDLYNFFCFWLLLGFVFYLFDGRLVESAFDFRHIIIHTFFLVSLLFFFNVDYDLQGVAFRDAQLL